MADLTEPIADAAEVAKRKVGPLPIAAWAAIGIAIVAGVAWYRRRQGNGPADAPTEPVGDSPTVAPTAVNPVLTSGFTVGAAAGSTSTAPSAGLDWSAPVAKTNYDWRQAAESFAIGAGFAPTLAASAIGKYLNGQGLTVQERAIVDTVLRNVGPTPEPVPPPFNEPDGTGTGTGTGQDGGPVPGSEVGEPPPPPAPPDGTVIFTDQLNATRSTTSSGPGAKYVAVWQGGGYKTLLEHKSGLTYRLWGPIAGGLAEPELTQYVQYLNSVFASAGITVVKS